MRFHRLVAFTPQSGLQLKEADLTMTTLNGKTLHARLGLRSNSTLRGSGSEGSSCSSRSSLRSSPRFLSLSQAIYSIDMLRSCP